MIDLDADWLAFLVLLAAWAFMLLGCFFLLVGAFGLIRLPDFWSRLHAASIIDSAGVFFILIALALVSGPNLVTVKLVLIAIFLGITGPTASHAVANAAWVAGSRPRDTVEDQTGDGFTPVLPLRPHGPLSSSATPSSATPSSVTPSGAIPGEGAR